MFGWDENEGNDKTCRTCLKTDAPEMVSLFEPGLLNMFATCTKVMIAENDGFPRQICSMCFQKISDAFDFSKQCEAADQTLRKVRESNLNDSPEIEEVVDDCVPGAGKLNRCEECGKEFRYRYEVLRHRWIHTEPAFKCAACAKKFKKKDWLDRHFKACHTGERARQVCKICGKSVVRLEQHNDMHRGERHPCGECAQEFTNKCALRAHQTRKHGTKAFLCTVCGVRADTITALKSHMTSHTDTRNYRCTVCAKHFKTSAMLNKHVRFTHEHVKMAVCHICSKSFCSTSVLKLHMRTHTGEKPHRCAICAKAFTQKSSLRTHMKTHGGGGSVQI